MKVKAIDNRSIFIPCYNYAEFINAFPHNRCKIDGEEYYIGSTVHYEEGFQIELISKNVVEIEIEEIEK